MSRNLVSALAIAIACATAGTAQAQQDFGKSAGDFLIRLRGVGIVADGQNSVRAGGADTGLETEVDNAIVPELDFTYFLTDNIAFELIAATARHNVEASGGGTTVDLGSVWLLPPTLTVQYHFFPKSQFSPYIGAGLNYTLFYNPDAGDADGIDYENSIGYALQAGLDVQLSPNWLINFDVKRLWLDTDVRVRTGGAVLDADVDIDPWIVGVGIGYRF